MVATKNTLAYAKEIEHDGGKYPEVNNFALKIGGSCSYGSLL